MNGLQRYNAIQKALAEEKRAKGWKFVGGRFQGLASEIYQSTKGDPLNQVVDNMDVLATGVPSVEEPFFPSPLLDWAPYFDFDVENKGPHGKWSPTTGAENIFIKSPAILGDEIIRSTDLSYEEHFAKFTAYCDANRGLWWVDSSGAPLFRFTPPELDMADGRYYTELQIDDLDAYGFDPDMGPVVQDIVRQPLPEEGEEEEVVVRPEMEDLKIKASEQKKRLRLLQEEGEPSKIPSREREIKAETKKIKASTAKLREISTLTKQYTDLYKDGIITKSELRDYLAAFRKT